MKNFRIYDTHDSAAAALASDISELVNSSDRNNFNIALSGGTTPMLLYDKLASDYALNTNWQKVHFWWGDERCVPPDHSESNYGNTRQFLMDKILFNIISQKATGEQHLNKAPIRPNQIHPISGEIKPEEAAALYEHLIKTHLRERQGIPAFDLVLLGMGDDGHVASIFPDRLSLFHSDTICEVSVHPVTGQKRITLTGRVINNADRVVFLVTGKSKAKLIAGIINDDQECSSLPAYHVNPANAELFFYLDREAAQFIKAE